MNRRLTPSQENYLEEACRFPAGCPVRISSLARKLGLSVPCVSRGVSILVRKGFVRHRSYGVVELTPDGMEVGNEIIRRHACLQRLFIDVLGMTPPEAESPIHLLEHGLTRDLLVRLETLTTLALSSRAWCRRLHNRIELRLGRAQGKAVRDSAEEICI